MPLPRRSSVRTPNAPTPTESAPYAQAIAFGDLLFVSGQLPVDPTSGLIVDGGLAAQVRQVIRNLEAVLNAAESDLDHLLKTTVFLRARSDWRAMNDVYSEMIGNAPPARSAIVVGELAYGALVEIEAIAGRRSATTA